MDSLTTHAETTRGKHHSIMGLTASGRHASGQMRVTGPHPTMWRMGNGKRESLGEDKRANDEPDQLERAAATKATAKAKATVEPRSRAA